MIRVLKCIGEYCKKNKLPDNQVYEIECRLGDIDLATGHFSPGYTAEELKNVDGLIKALESKECQAESISDQIYSIAYYNDGTRKSTVSSSFLKKQPILTVDFVTNRQKDVRIALSVEKSKSIGPNSTHPTGIVVAQRKSYRILDHQIDITKRTKKTQSKRDCTLYLCDFHVEIECPTQNNKVNVTVAILNAVLGNYIKQSDPSQNGKSTHAYSRRPTLTTKVHSIKTEVTAFENLKMIEL